MFLILMDVKTKEQFYELWQKGLFGNKLQTWNSLEEIKQSGYGGLITIRSKEVASAFQSYNVPLMEIEKTRAEWIKQGYDPNLITFNESAPDHLLLLQGELMEYNNGLYLFYSQEKVKMREALKEGREAIGKEAEQLLRKHCNQVSFQDIMDLLQRFPGHVIEFSTYSCMLGNIPGRNTIIWEVRKY